MTTKQAAAPELVTAEEFRVGYAAGVLEIENLLRIVAANPAVGRMTDKSVGYAIGRFLCELLVNGPEELPAEGAGRLQGMLDTLAALAWRGFVGMIPNDGQGCVH